MYKILKALHQHYVNYCSLSFIDKVKTIGGFFIMMYIPLLIGLIWFDTHTMIKLIATKPMLSAVFFRSVRQNVKLLNT